MSDAKTVRVNIATSFPAPSSSTPIVTPTPPTAQNTFTLSEETKRMIRTSTAVPGIPTVDLSTPSNNAVNVARVMRLFPESKWNEIFPVKKSIYTYSELLKAIAKFPLFCNDRAPDSDMDLDTACKTELATIFAHMVQETGGHSPSGYLPDNLGTTYPEWKQGLYYIREVYCTALGTGCEYRGETCNLDNYF
jgi:chitodextrinase